MAWTNGNLIVYHGTDDVSASAIIAPSGANSHGVVLSLCALLTDFGQGFYATTRIHQARQWANQRCRRLLAGRAGATPTATVIKFELSRDQLSGLAHLAFVTDGRDYHDLIRYCRLGGNAHHRSSGPYDVVYGPVSLWRQTLVIADCDQIGLHTPKALAMLSNLSIAASGTEADSGMTLFPAGV